MSDSISRGDHIKAVGWVYDHHGIYVGINHVVHLSKEVDGIVETTLEEFLKGYEPGSCLKEEHKDPAYSLSESARRAESRVGEKGYSVFSNCEHFCNWCVTGKATSGQVQSYAISAAVIALLTGGVAYASRK